MPLMLSEEELREMEEQLLFEITCEEKGIIINYKDVDKKYFNRLVYDKVFVTNKPVKT